MSEPAPRIAPGTWRETGLLPQLAARIGGRASGTAPMALFRVLGRHRSLFLAWLPFSGRLLRGSALSRRDVELVIVRVAHLRGCHYELDHHRGRAHRLGVDPDAVAAGRVDGDRDRALLAATDALIRDRDVDDETWATLREHVTERAAIELCLLAGHYDLLATTIATLRIPRDRRR